MKSQHKNRTAQSKPEINWLDCACIFILFVDFLLIYLNFPAF